MRSFLSALLLLVSFLPAPLLAGEINVPILLYHRFAPTVADSMTITTPVLTEHLDYLKQNGFTVIPLRRLVNYLNKSDLKPLPKKPVVIVADDAHQSVYSVLYPLAKKYQIPVTLFTYPSAISNASYAMTWNELREVESSGLFDIQSHTFWHPNFKKEKKRLSQAEYEKLVDVQLIKAKKKLEKEIGKPVDILAWPFGIYDEELIKRATAAGYTALLTIEARPVKNGERLAALPRFLLSNQDRGNRFIRIVEKASGG
jgi:peptidoglycan/xylan/chitin deacetylase (PgdA/CDA1 family)